MARDGNNAVITIEDDGPHSEERATDLFHHWTPIEDHEEATLVGISFAEKIVKAHGGELAHAATDKGGTRIQLALPMHSPAGSAPADESCPVIDTARP